MAIEGGVGTTTWFRFAPQLVQKSSVGGLDVPQFKQTLFWAGRAATAPATGPETGRGRLPDCALILLLTAAAVAPARTAPQLSQNSSVGFIGAPHTGHFINQ